LDASAEFFLSVASQYWRRILKQRDLPRAQQIVSDKLRQQHMVLVVMPLGLHVFLGVPMRLAF
jgi:hypothetical protein